MKRHCVAEVLLAIWDIFLHDNNRKYNSYRFSYKFAFMLVLSFLTNQKQKSGFQQWWSGNEKYFYFLFIASRGLLRGLLQEMKGDFLLNSCITGTAICYNFPVDTGRKLNVHKTFKRRPGRLLNVLCTFNLCPVSRGLFINHNFWTLYIQI